MKRAARERALEGLLRALPEGGAPLAARWRSALAGGDEREAEALLDEAERHGLGPLVLDALRASDLLPAPLAARAARELAVARLRTARLEADLAAALRALAAAELPAVALKGPLLARRLYPEPALRLSSDLDLLVTPAALERAVAALVAAGWHEPAVPVQRHLRRHFAHLHLERPGGPLLELHFHIDAAVGRELPADVLLARARRAVGPQGAPAWVLAPEDELVTLALHALKHGFARLAWLYDLALFLRRGAFDWPALAARARAWGVGSALALALARVRDRLGAPLPDLRALGLFEPGRARRAACEALLALGERPDTPRRAAAAARLAGRLLVAGRHGPALVAHTVGVFVGHQRARRDPAWPRA